MMLSTNSCGSVRGRSSLGRYSEVGLAGLLFVHSCVPFSWVGRLVVTGQLPLLPPLFWLLAKLAELWPTEACLPVRARGGKFPEEISDEGAPQGHFVHRRPRRRRG